MIIGFTTGEPKGLSLKERLRIFRDVGCNAIELGLINAADEQRWKQIEALTEDDVSDFRFVSLHAPALEFTYNNDPQTKEVLNRIQVVYDRLRFRHAIIHPDRVVDWSVFASVSFPIATENMDNRKQSYKDPESLLPVLQQLHCPMVLDMNHCFANDPTLALASRFYKSFRDSICQIHTSGIGEQAHMSLHVTSQEQIVASIPDKQLPIIIESPTGDEEVIRKEFKYVAGILKRYE